MTFAIKRRTDGFWWDDAKQRWVDTRTKGCMFASLDSIGGEFDGLLSNGFDVRLVTFRAKPKAKVLERFQYVGELGTAQRKSNTWFDKIGDADQPVRLILEVLETKP